MKPKVLFELSWHDGIPDGQHNIQLIREDYNLYDPSATIEEISKALTEYGSTDIQYQYCFGHEYHFTAIIGEYPQLKQYFSNHTITVTVSPIIEHHGRHFKMEEISQ